MTTKTKAIAKRNPSSMARHRKRNPNAEVRRLGVLAAVGALGGLLAVAASKAATIEGKQGKAIAIGAVLAAGTAAVLGTTAMNWID